MDIEKKELPKLTSEIKLNRQLLDQNNVWYQESDKKFSATMEFMNPAFERIETLEDYCMTSIPIFT
jgi:hypothetical protein